jgi:hypothetical protein
VVGGLLCVCSGCVLATEPQKIRHFCAGIDFGLPHVLAGTEHRRSAQLRAAGPAHEISGFECYGNTVCKGHVVPVTASLQSAFDRIAVLHGVNDLYACFGD